jgi:hypothetical protein
VKLSMTLSTCGQGQANRDEVLELGTVEAPNREWRKNKSNWHKCHSCFSVSKEFSCTKCQSGLLPKTDTSAKAVCCSKLAQVHKCQSRLAKTGG